MYTLFLTPNEWFKVARGNTPEFQAMLYDAFTNPMKALLATPSSGNSNSDKPTAVISDSGHNWFNTRTPNGSPYKSIEGNNIASQGMVMYFPFGHMPNIRQRSNMFGKSDFNQITHQNHGETSLVYTDPNNIKMTSESNYVFAARIPAVEYTELKDEVGFKYLTLDIAKSFIDMSKENPLDTPNIKTYNKALDALRVKDWSPTRDLETFARAYGLNLEERDAQKRVFTLAKTPLDKAIKGQYSNIASHEVIEPVIKSYNGNVNEKRTSILLNNNLGDITIVIPRLKNDQPEINAQLVYKTIADRLVTKRPKYHTNPYSSVRDIKSRNNTLAWATYLHDWNNSYQLPPMARNWYHLYNSNSSLQVVSPVLFASQYKDPQSIGVSTHAYDGFYGDTTSLSGMMAPSTNGEYLLPRSNLLFHMEDTSKYGGKFTWEAPDDHNFFSGSFSISYVYANSVEPELLINPYEMGPAFIPASFGEDVVVQRLLPVGKAEVETLNASLSASNTDEVRRKLWNEFFAKTTVDVDGNRTPEFSDELFDKIIDAPKTALPYVYNEEDLLVGGKYRPNVLKNTPAKLAKGDFNNSNWIPIELALPYTGKKMPTAKDGGKWAGIGHVLPFELVYAPVSITRGHVTTAQKREFASAMITRADYGMDSLGGMDDGHSAYGYNPKFHPVHFTMRFDLDHIFTPVQSGYMAYPNADSTEFVFKAHKSNLPSIHLTNQEEDALKNLHMLVPPRVLANDGNPTVTRFHNNLEAYKAESVRSWVPRPIYGDSKPIQFYQHDHGGFDPNKDMYLRPISRFTMKGENGKLTILDPAVTTKTKTDVFFNNRIVSHDVLDAIRGGRHFANYAFVNETDLFAGEHGIPSKHFSTADEAQYGKRYKNWVDAEMRKYFAVPNVNTEVPYLRDLKPLSIKDDVDYISSDGFSMIVKPGDYTRAFLDMEGNLATHADQTVPTTTLKRWYKDSIAPLQDPAHTNSWMELAPEARSPYLYVTSASDTANVVDKASYAYWGTTDQPWSYHSNLARHVKASQDLANPDVNGKVISTTASYLLSFIFKQARTVANEGNVLTSLGNATANLEVSSLFWFDEELVASQMRKASNAYGGVAPFSGIVSEAKLPKWVHDSMNKYFHYEGRTYGPPSSTDILANYHVTVPLMHRDVAYGGRTNFMVDGYKNDSIGLSHSFVNMYDSFLPQPSPELIKQLPDLREELRQLSSASSLDETKQARKDELTKILEENDIPFKEQVMYHNRLRIFEYDALIQVSPNDSSRLFGEFNTDNVHSANVMTYLPSYVKNDTLRVYSNYNTPMVRAINNNIAKHFWTPPGYVRGGNDPHDVIDMTTAFKMQNPMTQTTTAIATRVWEPTDLIIPTTLVEDGNWENPEDWVKVEGYENTNTYALMKEMAIGSTPTYRQDVRCYPVSVPIMYRKPKHAFDLMVRLANPAGGLLRGTIDMFDVLASDKPFIFTFYVADIAFLIENRALTAPELAARYDAKTNTFYKPGVDVSGGLSEENSDALRVEIAELIGISPVMLKVDLTDGVYRVHCTDEFVELGIPMFAGFINVEFGDKPVKLETKTVVVTGAVKQQGIGSHNSIANYDDETLKTFASGIANKMAKARETDAASDKRKSDKLLGIATSSGGELRWVSNWYAHMIVGGVDDLDQSYAHTMNYGTRVVYGVPPERAPLSTENPRAQYWAIFLTSATNDDGETIQVYDMQPNFSYNPYDSGDERPIGDEE